MSVIENLKDAKFVSHKRRDECVYKCHQISVLCTRFELSRHALLVFVLGITLFCIGNTDYE